jgi:hypothetical protein
VFLVFATAGLTLAIGLRGKLRRRDRLRPGILTALVGSVAITYHMMRVGFWAIDYVIRPPRSEFPGDPAKNFWELHPFFSLWDLAEFGVRWMIAGAWMVLVATGRWRAPVSWEDRLGRWLGWGWMVLAVCDWLFWTGGRFM